MDILIQPSPLGGELCAIPSKSDAHRLIICAALADKPTRLHLPSSSRDIDATCACMRALGASIAREGEYLTISPLLPVSEPPLLDCGESGSTLRFLLPVATALYERVRFVGHGRLPERPLKDLQDAMRAHGVDFSSDTLPFETKGRLRGGEFRIAGNVSSQYITGLLLAAAALGEDSRIVLTSGLESASYVDITLHALRRFGLQVDEFGDGWALKGGQRLRSADELAVEGDWSNAAFPLVGGLLGDGLTLCGLTPQSPQGDRAIVSVLRRFGAMLDVSDDRVRVFPSLLRGIEVDMRDIPDALPALAVVAAYAEGETRFINAARLRLKESDRLQAVCAMLKALGGEAEELPDGLIVFGRQGLHGGEVDGFGDHRIVMAAAIAASRADGEVILRGAEAAEKSYPAFFDHFQALGGKCHVL